MTPTTKLAARIAAVLLTAMPLAALAIPVPTSSPTPSPTASPTVTPTVTPIPTPVLYGPGTYTVDFYAGSEGGSITEVDETSNIGGAVSNQTTNGFLVGDTAAKQQIVAVTTFDTSVIPAGAYVTAGSLTLNALTTNGVPTGLAPLVVDVKSGVFGTTAAVEASDFEAPATAVAAASFPATTATAATQSLSVAGLDAVNKGGKTQVRLRFATDDNDNTTADRLELASGNSSVSSRKPKLTLTFTVPTTVTLYSIPAEDASVVESGPTTSVGGTLDAGGTSQILVVGDKVNLQEVAIVSFNTASIPSGATIYGATLSLSGITNVRNPATLGPLVADIKKGTFGAAAVEITDFEATATANAVATFPAAAPFTSAQPLSPSGLAGINGGGKTQFRIRLTQSNPAATASNAVTIGSGENSTIALRPTLVVTYRP